MWKYGLASVIGTSHARANVPVQDASRAAIRQDAHGAELLFAVVSDGAGSAAQAQVGSQLACEFWLEAVTAHCVAGGTLAQLADGFFPRWLKECQQRFLQTAQATDSRMDDYACTFLAAVVGTAEAVYFQLGDGAMIESVGEDYSIVCWPQQGEYANTTNFLTDADGASKCFIERRNHRVDEVALFTDGIQNLVLDYRTRTAHAPFFAPLFAWLRPRADGHSEELSQSLGVYLNSAKINARTDDDKTLILATRRI